MKKLLLILAVLGLAAAIGYVLGTENGRHQRDRALARLQGTRDFAEGAADAIVADIREPAANRTAQIETASS
ncbi:MAG: hypothetical protein OEW42_16770 [Acidimicrobiia bacterium]|nr:hypothetical protein [Acidimicrobiia bacterium]